MAQVSARSRRPSHGITQWIDCMRGMVVLACVVLTDLPGFVENPCLHACC